MPCLLAASAESKDEKCTIARDSPKSPMIFPGERCYMELDGGFAGEASQPTSSTGIQKSVRRALMVAVLDASPLHPKKSANPVVASL
ncbi:hypothetical protein DSO57_1034589 [Entomophthora muscae]|uniref:Uncharacterized protein n=1 Tax=Entomophthora muscae TaxID=34485 RepID=A0ACC2U8T3_9FUNG|nr:hypothetical protein DSO57_1034589 [Entomophthora muscae]